MRADMPLSGAVTVTPPPRATIAVLVSCGILVSVMQTLTVPLLPRFPRLLDTSAANASWVITVTLLTGAVCTPVAGRLGDLYGKRLLLLIGLTLLTAGSGVCAVSHTVAPMVVGRALQGAALGVVPLAMAVLRDEVPPDRLGGAVGLMSATAGVGGAVGLPIAALVVQSTDYHALFWGAAVLGAGCFGLVLAFVPASKGRTYPGRFDAWGTAGLAVGLVSVLIAVGKGAQWGWLDPRTLTLAGVGVAVLAGWAVVELRSDCPLVDLRTAASPRILATNAATVVLGFAMYAQNLVFPQIMQLPKSTGYGLGVPLVTAGLYLAPPGFVMMLVATQSARLSRARGPKTSLVAGAAILVLAYAAAPALLGSPLRIVGVSLFLVIGIGLAFAAMPALVIAAVPARDTGAATGLNALMRSVGMTVSAAVIGVVLAHDPQQSDGAPVPTESAFVTALGVGLAASALGLVLALLIPRGPRDAADSAQPDGPGYADQAPESSANSARP
jgi:MFS family permease